MKDDRRLARGRRWFEYHCWESEDSCDAELWHHTHQQVIVLSKYKYEKGDEELKVYKARFPDGFEYDVFGDELIASPKDFYRPDYVVLGAGLQPSR